MYGQVNPSHKIADPKEKIQRLRAEKSNVNPRS